MTSDLSGRTVLVAGASSGMGLAIGTAAARAGAGLVLLARREAALAEAVQAVRAAAPSADVTMIVADAADAAGLAQALERHAQALRRVDTLVNSVGCNIVERAFDQLTPQSWAGMLASNLDAAFNLTQAVLPAMRERRDGLVIHIASTAARKADRSGAAYQAAKAGVVALTHAVMEEERENGIRMTAIMPGMTDTPLLDRRPTPIPAEARAAALQPEDIAAACLFVMGLPARAHVAEILMQPRKN
ncbi:SDR family oxidoreductase [Geminicoccus roseus]|uniref:SDR family oxidoreductase n=1 Tax=Geminicoccus roseus TaxID=404900 RepID=UPI00041709D4|nr:SDR family NAD(P)-dependent oxidoreductase [Geminicoccus roseus]